MKKTIFILIGILFILPCVVSADMGSPAIIEYKASVNNPDGAVVYKQDDDNKYIETDLIAPFGTTFTIGWEEEDEGYVDYEIDKYEEDNITYYVSLKDLTIIEKKYTPKESELLPKEKALVLKDVIIKEGPAKGYESTGVTIKAGTNIEIRLFGELNEDNEYIYNSSIPWMYVEYNKTKGFINSYGASIAYREYTDKMLTDEDVDIRDPKTDKVIGSIPANTEFSNNVFRLDDWSGSYYVKYNNINGIVYRYAFIWQDNPTEFTAKNKLKIYSKLYDDMEINSKKLTTISTIDSGEKFKSSYYDIYDGCRIYYEKDNIKGWIYTNLNDDEESEGECVGIIINSDDEPSEEEREDVDIENPTTDELEDVSDPVPSNTLQNKKTYSMNTLYICIVVAICMTIVTAIVVMILNKKKREGN